MRLKCLSCEALARMVYYHSAFSPHMIDVEIVKLGLHNTPDELRSNLQQRIDALASGSIRYDAVVMAYGLCGKATHGLTAREIPVIVPRAHDCITLFLGGRERYKDQFENKPGTYWYALDYLQRNDGSATVLSLGASEVATDLQATYASYVEKYGQDNADYLMGIMGAWQQHYQRAVYVDMNIGDGSVVEKQAQDDAMNRGWTFEKIQGDSALVKRLLYGEWEQDFLVLNPGEKLRMTFDERIIGAEKLA
jgi:hypothetical protein